MENVERTFFFFFSLFKTTKICFGSTKMEILVDPKQILVSTKMEIFYREKAFSQREKNQEK